MASYITTASTSWRIEREYFKLRYTITSVDTDQTLATVDHIQTPTRTSWEVNLSGKKQKSLKNLQVEVGKEQITIRGMESIQNYPYLEESEKFYFATALGLIAIHPTRGQIDSATQGKLTSHIIIKSTMPGKVVQILCKLGDQVKASQPLLVIEAMKMENEICAPHDGVIDKLVVEIGQKVEAGQLLVQFV